MPDRGSAAHRFQSVPEAQLFMSCTPTHRCSRHREQGHCLAQRGEGHYPLPFSHSIIGVCVPSVDQTGLIPQQNENLFCSMMTPYLCPTPKHSCTLAVWPEPGFSCVIYVRIHLTLEPMDQLCQHWLGCQIPSDQEIMQTLRWWKWSIKWQFGLVFGRVGAFEIELIFTRDNQHTKN